MKNTIKKSLLILGFGGLLSVGVAVAQDPAASTPTTPSATTNAAPTAAPANDRDPHNFDPGHPRVNEVDQRQVNQQERIGQGLKSGSLTAGEAIQLEKNQQHIEAQKKADMAANGGHLTKAEQNQLNREQNRQSRAIYRDKHNNRTR